jgi:hypothetical protein
MRQREGERPDLLAFEHALRSPLGERTDVFDGVAVENLVSLESDVADVRCDDSVRQAAQRVVFRQRSCSNTSSPAPAMRCSRSAATSAVSSTIAERW